MRILIEMRRKMLAAVERGEPVADVARRFEVSERGLQKLIRLVRERGTLEPAKPGRKSPTKLTPEDDATMLFGGPMNAVTFLGWVVSCLVPSRGPETSW